MRFLLKKRILVMAKLQMQLLLILFAVNIRYRKVIYFLLNKQLFCLSYVKGRFNTKMQLRRDRTVEAEFRCFEA